MPVFPFVLGAIATGAAVARHLYARHLERQCAERLPQGPDGIVRGAEPIDLPGTGTRAVLLVHGFGDTPQTLTYLATHLHSLGYSVRAPLLPGHGRSLPEFAATRAEDWIGFVRAELEAMRRRYGAQNVALVGLSMGGALSAITAAGFPDLPVLVLVAPYVSMPAGLRRLALLHPLVGAAVPYLAARGEASIHDKEEQARNRGYGSLTPRLLYELMRVVDRVRVSLPRVTAPTLVVQSRHDNRVPPHACEAAFGTLTCTKKQLEWLENTGHVLTVDFQKERVFELAAAWIDEHLPERRAPEATSVEKRRSRTTA